MRETLVEMASRGSTHELIDVVLKLFAQLTAENARLAEQLANALRPFARKSEKVDAAQLALAFQKLSDADRAAANVDETPPPCPPNEKPEEKSPRPKPTGRLALPKDLPREINVIKPPAEEMVCEWCGGEKTCFGHVTSERLEFVPGYLKVIEDRRLKAACKKCEEGVVTAPVAAKVIEGGRPGTSLLAHLVVSKFSYHLPLYRLEKLYTHMGVRIASSTLGSWVAGVSDALLPLYRMMVDDMLRAWFVSADDTGVRVLDKDHPEGVKKGHLWPYVASLESVVFAYTQTWEGKGPQTFLADARCTHFQADAYPGFDKLIKRKKLIEVGCWMHCRRKFKTALDEKDERAAVAIKLIQDMYAVEDDARDKSPDERRALRQEKTAPILKRLLEWMSKTRGQAPPKTPLGQAFTYLTNQQAALSRFLDDGRLPIDNGAVERVLKAIAIGRKNWLFIGSDAAAERACVIYSVLGTCALHGVDPQAYIEDVLQKIADGWPDSRRRDLLPAAWAAAHPEHVTRA